MTQEELNRLDDIAEKINEMSVSIATMANTVSTMSGRFDDHENRIRDVESWQQRMTPFFAVMTFVAGAIGAVLIEKYIR